MTSVSTKSKKHTETYLELADELGQYELVSLDAARRRQHVGHRPVDWNLLLVRHALQVAAKPNVAR